ncbi:MAG: hypothetical protein S4CHLAM81_11930 [Chlamydiales bacterium]|nr:hypothetical protein [Chlamydiales bacterium]MCH9635969.1 hypothetical protein [Chlamydiales bacterium]
MSEKKRSEFTSRLLIMSISSVLVAAFIFLGAYAPLRWVFTSAVAGIAAIALFEYYVLVKQKGFSPAFTLGVVTAVLYIFATFFKTQGPHPHWHTLWQKMPEIILTIGFFGCFVRYAWVGKDPIVNIATSFLGIVYLAVPFALMVRIMYFFVFDGQADPHFQGSWWIIYLIVVTKISDMGGYFVGRTAGRRKLAFSISPNKTFEGALGGLVCSIGMSLLLCYLGKRFGQVFMGFSYMSSVWLGVLLGIFGQLGDLAESLLKRDANVKDSNTLPGVGGILDMTDSMLFTSPVLYIFLRVLYA